VSEDLFDDLGLVNEGDDAHGAPTPCTQQGIGLVDFLDQVCPALFEKRRARRRRNLDSSGGRCVLSLLFGLLAFPPIDVAVKDNVTDCRKARV